MDSGWITALFDWVQEIEIEAILGIVTQIDEVVMVKYRVRWKNVCV
jgi:hypothetical protein